MRQNLAAVPIAKKSKFEGAQFGSSGSSWGEYRAMPSPSTEKFVDSKDPPSYKFLKFHWAVHKFHQAERQCATHTFNCGGIE